MRPILYSSPKVTDVALRIDNETLLPSASTAHVMGEMYEMHACRKT